MSDSDDRDPGPDPDGDPGPDHDPGGDTGQDRGRHPGDRLERIEQRLGQVDGTALQDRPALFEEVNELLAAELADLDQS